MKKVHSVLLINLSSLVGLNTYAHKNLPRAGSLFAYRQPGTEAKHSAWSGPANSEGCQQQMCLQLYTSHLDWRWETSESSLFGVLFHKSSIISLANSVTGHWKVGGQCNRTWGFLAALTILWDEVTVVPVHSELFLKTSKKGQEGKTHNTGQVS